MIAAIVWSPVEEGAIFIPVVRGPKGSGINASWAMRGRAVSVDVKGCPVLDSGGVIRDGPG